MSKVYGATDAFKKIVDTHRIKLYYKAENSVVQKLGDYALLTPSQFISSSIGFSYYRTSKCLYVEFDYPINFKKRHRINKSLSEGDDIITLNEKAETKLHLFYFEEQGVYPYRDFKILSKMMFENITLENLGECLSIAMNWAKTLEGVDIQSGLKTNLISCLDSLG